MSTLKFDLAQNGLLCVLKPWQAEIMRHLWTAKKPMISREAHQHLQDVGGDVAVSRASVINFLNYMADEGLLTYIEKTGKGGHHRVYSPTDDTEQNFRETVYQRFIKKLKKEYGKNEDKDDPHSLALETLIEEMERIIQTEKGIHITHPLKEAIFSIVRDAWEAAEEAEE